MAWLCRAPCNNFDQCRPIITDLDYKNQRDELMHYELQFVLSWKYKFQYIDITMTIPFTGINELMSILLKIIHVLSLFLFNTLLLLQSTTVGITCWTVVTIIQPTNTPAYWFRFLLQPIPMMQTSTSASVTAPTPAWTLQLPPNCPTVPPCRAMCLITQTTNFDAYLEHQAAIFTCTHRVYQGTTAFRYGSSRFMEIRL